MKIKWAIIGAGDIASDRFAPALKKSKNSELVAVIDKNVEVAKALARKFGAEHSSSNVNDLLWMEDVMAVYVATWPSAHCENVTVAASAGKHVLCEKPLAMTLDECDRMIEACKRNHVKLMVGYVMRFNNAHAMVKKMIQDGHIGDVMIAKADFFTPLRLRWGSGFDKTFKFDRLKGGGGVLMDIGIHLVDLIRYLTQQDITSVSSYHTNLAYGTQVEDTATIAFQLKNGSLGSINLSWGISGGRNGVELYSEIGAIISEGSIGRAPEHQLVRLLRDRTWEKFDLEGNDAYFDELQYFEKCLYEGHYPEADGYEGKRDLEVILAAYESMREGRSVLTPSIREDRLR